MCDRYFSVTAPIDRRRRRDDVCGRFLHPARSSDGEQLRAAARAGQREGGEAGEKEETRARLSVTDTSHHARRRLSHTRSGPCQTRARARVLLAIYSYDALRPHPLCSFFLPSCFSSAETITETVFVAVRTNSRFNYV